MKELTHRFKQHLDDLTDDEYHQYYDTFHDLMWVLLQFAAVYDTHPGYHPDRRPLP